MFVDVCYPKYYRHCMRLTDWNCTETVQLEGVTVTLEGVKDGVQGLGKMLGDIGSSATRIEDRLNALLTFFQAGKLAHFWTPTDNCANLAQIYIPHLRRP